MDDYDEEQLGAEGRGEEPSAYQVVQEQRRRHAPRPARYLVRGKK